MFSIALKMLFHDRAKYLGLVLGVAFSTLLINQQLGIFIGLITRAGAVIVDFPQADVWVMDPGVKNLDTIFPLRDTELGRVRGVPGVAWAVPLYKSNVTIRTGNGELESSLLMGVDDSTLIGLPPEEHGWLSQDMAKRTVKARQYRRAQRPSSRGCSDRQRLAEVHLVDHFLHSVFPGFAVHQQWPQPDVVYCCPQR